MRVEGRHRCDGLRSAPRTTLLEPEAHRVEPGGTRSAPAQFGPVHETRAAAVVVAIFADPPHPVVFVERAAHLRHHPGQIGLPGGTVDAADGHDRARTALRELHEEIGVSPDRVTLAGQLPEARQRTNAFAVTPFVGVLASGTALAIDATETAAVFTVPLAAIVAPGAVHRGIETVGELGIETWMFDHGGLHVWGLTAGILRAFVSAWHEPDSALRAAIQSAFVSPV